MSKLKLLLLTALPFSAFSQAIKLIPPPGPTVCMPVAQAAKVRDSLTVLPKVRREARTWRKAATSYRTAADTAQAAYVRQVAATANVQLALREETIEATRYEVSAKKWKGKAQRRGFWSWLG
ncbi:hypothetical protein FNT36_18565 [Hymenobacter setariae]|uniref:DUF4398 domain-containing protein n=1 Tax=Hymenobacter setariae TaxID=2594794 RepID=A0A558BT29_9BACT|nr:hypothetical protein [Hymenobacter setariae]TVT39645.1 hypothetical protein FNT36_18565 [Hymenobacter setariae]